MNEQVVLYRLSTIYHKIGNSECRDIHRTLSAAFEFQFPALVYRENKFLVRISGVERDLKNQFFISINAKYIIAHHPALADISGSEAHIIEFISQIK